MGRRAKREGKTKAARELFDWIQGKGLTYESAGELLGLKKSEISKYINGRCIPCTKTIYRISMLTGITMDSWLKKHTR